MAKKSSTGRNIKAKTRWAFNVYGTDGSILTSDIIPNDCPKVLLVKAINDGIVITPDMYSDIDDFGFAFRPSTDVSLRGWYTLFEYAIYHGYKFSNATDVILASYKDTARCHRYNMPHIVPGNEPTPYIIQDTRAYVLCVTKLIRHGRGHMLPLGLLFEELSQSEAEHIISVGSKYSIPDELMGILYRRAGNPVMAEFVRLTDDTI